MPHSNLDRAKEEFERQMARSFDLIQDINQITPPLPKDKIYTIYELSFLKLLLAWEWFIERTFILFMMGESTIKGYVPNRYVSPKDEQHAYDLIKGGKFYFKYLDWITPSTVIEKANLFFENGEPYRDSLHPIIQDLQDMKTLRNAIVHISKESQEKFESMVRNKIGYFHTGTTPGEFLSDLIKDSKKTYIAYFKERFEIVSEKIVK